jgi:predicted transcriptional regulator
LEYRKQPRIVADVLTAVRDLNYGEGVSITTLLRKCNVSYSRLKPLISTLVGSGLLEEREKERPVTYLISQNGITFLRAWSSFNDFAQSYGLKLQGEA